MCLQTCTPLAQAEAPKPSPVWAGDASTDVPASKLPVIDDRAILDKLGREGARLLEAGKLTSGGELRTQLDALRNKPIGQAVQGLLPARADASAAKDLYADCRRGILILAGLRKAEGNSKTIEVNTTCGFIVTASGVAVTNYHVVAFASLNGMVAMINDGHLVGVKSVLAASQAYDIAVLQLDGEGFTPLPIASAAAVGEKVATLSHPNSHFYCLSEGTVSRYSIVTWFKGLPPVAAMEISADFARGSSGGPVVNMAGQIVGMVQSTDSVYYDADAKGNPQNLQMVFKRCVPSEQIRRLLLGK